MHLVNYIFLAVAVFLLAGIPVALELGRRLGQRRLARDPEGARTGLGAVEGAVFALLGLLIAFTFNGAASRFEHRRELAVQEVNAVRTAWTRLDVLPEASRPGLRELFRRYLDWRLETSRRLPDVDATMSAVESTIAVQREIWSAATAACRTGEKVDAGFVLSALNHMFDVMMMQTMAMLDHPPAIIFGMLLLLSVCCSLLAGYGMAGARERSWTHMLGFALITAIVVYVILNLEYPRIGFIRVDAADQPLIRLREQMK